jgi:coenzyme Q-binding protein COQ10
MPKTHLVRRIQCDSQSLFDLVADVENYPKFITLISALRITKTISETEFEAEAIVSYKMISETFRSLVKIDQDAMKIAVTKAEKGGAVKSLVNRWAFYPLQDGSSLVDVVVDVKLKAMPLEFLLRDKFDRASTSIINAFEARARQQLPEVGEDDYDYADELAALGLKGIVV